MTGPPVLGTPIMSCSPYSRRLLSILFTGVLAISGLLFNSCRLLSTAASAGLIKLQLGCLPEGTGIDTPDGPVPVEQLKTGDRVIGYDGSIVTVHQLHQYQEDPSASRHLSVRFTNRAEIRLSPRHRVCGIPAGRLKPGDQLDGHTVSQIRPLAGVSRSFDLLTDDRGYRIQGIPVNSMIEEMAGR